MRTLKIFIVEDSPVILGNLIATLEELAPVQVVASADNETTAVAWLAHVEHQVDLVIIDIFLKGGSGLGVLRRASGLKLSTKLVVLSNYATPDMRIKCIELGADQVFDKSGEVEALIDYCEQLASNGTPSLTVPM